MAPHDPPANFSPARPDPHDEELPSQVELSPGDPPIQKPAWLRDMPYWALSAALHLLFLVTLLQVVSEVSPAREEESIPIRISQPPPKLPPQNPTLIKDIEQRRKFDLPKAPEFVRKTAEFVKPDIASKGVPDANQNLMNLDNMAIHDVLGVGGGVLGDRPVGPGGPVDGAPPGSEDAVLAALEWLRRHQSPDGRWSAADFTRQCRGTCRNEDPARYGDGRGFPDHDVGVTGLALLAFTGHGTTHRSGMYDEHVLCARKAMSYLLGTQVHSSDPSTNGRFGPGESEQWIYDHAIATMALGELLVLTRDGFKLKKPVTDAVKLCLRARNDGFGWRYGIKPGDNDTSVTGWMVLALKTARLARIEIPPEEIDAALGGALSWIDHATASSGRTGYLTPGDEGSRLASIKTDLYPYSKELSCMTAVGVLCRIFSGESRKSEMVRKGVQILVKNPPRWQEQKGRALSTINLYYWYYASYALFQYGGAEWKRWNEAMLEALLRSQRSGFICEDGSWDPIGEWGVAGGRVYATALGAMTLEVYYRFRRMREGIQFGDPPRSSSARRT